MEPDPRPIPVITQTIEQRAADERRLQLLTPDEREQIMLNWFHRDWAKRRRAAFERHVQRQAQKTAGHGKLPLALLPELRQQYRVLVRSAIVRYLSEQTRGAEAAQTAASAQGAAAPAPGAGRH